MGSEPYDPLERANLARSIAAEFENRPLMSFSAVSSIVGAGVYAIYYQGGFKAYGELAARNIERPGSAPIYVGKAIPSGGRKGELTLDSAAGNALSKRLRNHATSIRQAAVFDRENPPSDGAGLDIADFSIRYLVVADIWIPLGESMLIQEFKPIWNVLIDGFGNNQPGKGREMQVRSLWDTLHPGRTRVKKLPPNPLTRDQVVTRINDFMNGKSVPSVDERDSPVEDSSAVDDAG